MFYGPDNRLCPVRHAYFLIGIIEVGFNRRDSYLQLRPDGLVLIPVLQEFEYLQLSSCKELESGSGTAELRVCVITVIFIV